MINHDTFTAILREQIVPVTGRAEPLSIALCAAKAQQVLSMQPTSVSVSVNSSTLKNVRNVVVPNTNGLTGIRSAVAAGIICGDAKRGMQVLADLCDEQREAVVRFVESTPIDVSCAETECDPYISVTLYARTSYVRVVIANKFTNFVEIMKNGESLVKRPIELRKVEDPFDYSILNVHDIFEYACSVDIDEIRDLIDMQISYNLKFCEEAISGESHSKIGNIILSEGKTNPKTIAKAYVAAACDARMHGCEMPVASLCNSGNQGITATVPVVTFAKANDISGDRLYRALILSDFLTVYLFAYAGKQTSVCGSIFAACAASAAIAYLSGGNEDDVSNALIHTLQLVSGIRCFGAKPSCAAKIASAVETAHLGYHLSLSDDHVRRQDAIPTEIADNAVRNLELLASEALIDPALTADSAADIS